MNDETDWNIFRFPPPPHVRGVKKDEYSRAPSWAAPVQEVRGWHLDDHSWSIVHALLRKKIDLHRVTNKRRLARLCELISEQKNHEDCASLFLSLDLACRSAFLVSLPEMLAFGPNEWGWPILEPAPEEENCLPVGLQNNR